MAGLSRFKVANVVSVGLGCAACSGLPAPTGPIWDIVDRSAGAPEAAKPAIAAYLAGPLPASSYAYVAFLSAAGFQCSTVPGFKFDQGGTGPVECFYFARGPAGMNATCVAGVSLALKIRFSEADPVRDFDLSQISFRDPKAHGSDLCFNF